jgi:hypothetical protein
MLRPASIVAFLVAAACASSCNWLPTQPYEWFCCSSPESCAVMGEATVRPCTHPDRPFCTDDDLTHGQRFTCIADPLAQACSDPLACPAERPYCVDQRCAECRDDFDCDLGAPVCGADSGLCRACQDDRDCSGRPEATRCLVAEGACIQCLGPEECGAEAPFCDRHVCRGCRADTECASDVCDDGSGRCFDEDRVIYLAENGQTTGTCTRAAPCNSFALGLAQVTSSRDVIKAAPGTYHGPILISGQTVTIRALGATLRPLTFDQDIVTVTGGADVTIVGPRITGAGGTARPVGVKCDGATSTLRLHRSHVVDNSGGVRIAGCQYALVNNIIAGNGAASSVFGGVYISEIATGGLHQFEFNTVSRNVGTEGAITGVACATITTQLSFSSSIVYGNQVSGAGTQVGGDDDCRWTYSIVGPQGIAGDTNLASDPLFVNPGGGDFHIRTNSPAKNTADPAATIRIDIDGDRRPQGPYADRGADEVP